MVYVFFGILGALFAAYIWYQRWVDAGIPFNDPEYRDRDGSPSPSPVRELDTWQGIRIVGGGVIGAFGVIWILFLR